LYLYIFNNKSDCYNKHSFNNQSGVLYISINISSLISGGGGGPACGGASSHYYASQRGIITRAENFQFNIEGVLDVAHDTGNIFNYGHDAYIYLEVVSEIE
jgi:hypothetical protein